MSRIAMRTRPPMKMCGLKPITVLCLGKSGGGMCSCAWSRSWCSGMHTSLLCQCEDAPPGRKYFDAWESYAAMVSRSGNVIGIAGCVIWASARSCIDWMPKRRFGARWAGCSFATDSLLLIQLELFVAARAGHEFADGFFGALVVVKDG